MVGPGEVDDDLEPETAEECTKYGEVEKCVIFEVYLTNCTTEVLEPNHLLSKNKMPKSAVCSCADVTATCVMISTLYAW